ncbi:hypothetical protein VDG1235_4068 [Verrucomicrobiia bacterium DG1235]|nr:hypothetical protein VDG1235_4068 [Verrucomicrobiae bacterium DG1235]
MDIQSCLAEQKALRIEYSTGGRGEVTSLGLVHYLEYWHLIAWSRLRGDCRDFRSDRIQKLEVLDERVTRHGDFDLQAYMDKERSSSELLEAKVFFGKFVAGWARRDWYGLRNCFFRQDLRWQE